MESTMKIGRAAYLLRGLNAAWNPASGFNDILYSPEKEALDLQGIELPDTRGDWAYPEISLHATVQDLLSALVPYRIVDPASNVNSPSLPVGALLMGAAQNHDALIQLSATIGVNLTNPDFGYALVKLSRHDGEVSHASAAAGILVHMRPKAPDAAFRVSDAYYKSMVKLRHFGKSLNEVDTYGMDEANEYLAFSSNGVRTMSRGWIWATASCKYLPIHRPSSCTCKTPMPANPKNCQGQIHPSLPNLPPTSTKASLAL